MLWKYNFIHLIWFKTDIFSSPPYKLTCWSRLHLLWTEWHELSCAHMPLKLSRMCKISGSHNIIDEDSVLLEHVNR